VDGQFRLGKHLGSGSYATVYSAVNIINHNMHAVKLELCADGESSVEREYHILKELKGGLGGEGIPHAHWFSRESTYDALVLDLLGLLLHDLLLQYQMFSLSTVIALADQLVSHLEYIHSCGYIHGDMKPQNILMGLSDQGSTAFLVDFGVAKQYHNSATGDHIPFHNACCLTGTPSFASVNSHVGAELGWHDDLESLCYVLIYFLCGSLPWLDNSCRKSASLILKLKRTTPVEVLCSGIPGEFRTILVYVHSLSFAETPAYDYI
ncbi:kinase-like domain-containing protein, partial [Pisolithus sp. B1]